MTQKKKKKKVIARSDDSEVKKRKFDYSKCPIDRSNVGIVKRRIYSRVFFGKKHFKYLIGYKDDENHEPLYIMLLKMSGYAKRFDETKYVFFFDRDDQLAKK